MSNLDTIEFIDRTIDLIKDEKNWTQKTRSRNKSGISIPQLVQARTRGWEIIDEDEEPVAWCLTGALDRVFDLACRGNPEIMFDVIEVQHEVLRLLYERSKKWGQNWVLTDEVLAHRYRLTSLNDRLGHAYVMKLLRRTKFFLQRKKFIDSLMFWK